MFAIAFGWRHLLFEHYPVEPGVVEPALPDGLALDTYDGDAWLSVVPFTNVAVRPARLPGVLGFRLPELNLRTYVRGPGDGEPGVYFFSLDADGLLGVAAARWFHHLPYYCADIDLDVDSDGDSGVGGASSIDGDDAGGDHDVAGERVAFSSRRRHRGAWPAEYVAGYGPDGDLFRPEPGSLAEFLVERYRYYAVAPDGLRYAAVEHERWPLCEATAEVERNTLFAANGFEHPDSEPVLHYSPGVDVWASRSRRVA